MPKATWQGQVIAESDRTIVIEGNQYFPPEDVNQAHLRPSATQTRCGWKGIASYYDVVVEGAENRDAAWYYAEPMDAAREIAGYIAFWRGVEIVE